MNSLDAKVFEKLSSIKGYHKCFNPHIQITRGNEYYADATPEWYVGWTIDGFDEFDVSASLVRLSKFGLIELMYDRKVANVDYTDLENAPFLVNILNRYKQLEPNEELIIGGRRSVVYVNEYGTQFKKACQ